MGDRRFQSVGRRRARARGQVCPTSPSPTRPGARSTPAGDNAVLVEHALTGDSHVVGPAGPGAPDAGLVGRPDRPGLPARHRPLLRRGAPTCSAAARAPPARPRRRPTGGPGAAGSRSSRSATRCRSRRCSPTRLGIDALAAVLGGSMGGMRALEWAVDPPRAGRRCHRAGQHGIRHGRADRLVPGPAARDPRPTRTSAAATTTTSAGGPETGLGIARRIAHVTYRSELELHDRFGRAPAGRRGPARGRRALRRRELPRPPRGQAARPLRRQLLRRPDRGDELATTSAAAAAGVAPPSAGSPRGLRRRRPSTPTGSTRRGCPTRSPRPPRAPSCTPSPPPTATTAS